MLLPLGDGLYVVPTLVNLFAAALPIAALAFGVAVYQHSDDSRVEAALVALEHVIAMFILKPIWPTEHQNDSIPRHQHSNH